MTVEESLAAAGLLDADPGQPSIPRAVEAARKRYMRATGATYEQAAQEWPVAPVGTGLSLIEIEGLLPDRPTAEILAWIAGEGPDPWEGSGAGSALSAARLVLAPPDEGRVAVTLAPGASDAPAVVAVTVAGGTTEELVWRGSAAAWHTAMRGTLSEIAAESGGTC